MVVVTERAKKALRDLLSLQEGAVEGLRLVPEGEGGWGLRPDRPQATDYVIADAQGALLLVAPEVTKMAGELVVDCPETPEGSLYLVP